MILTVIMIGGIFLSATAIAGLLFFFQVQQATDFGNSTIAVFAADATMEEALYRFLFENDFNNCFNEPCQMTVNSFANEAYGEAEISVSDESVTIKTFGLDKGKRTMRSLENTLLIHP